ncbi:hypothetical protein J7T55_010495 [Diaporthe amygdali]|uniref:uncharacterized protein n=1 Tax=Phomopsis amygdali TaxID=1214568 RepID=UPI0022FF3F18|nr:uncharacterized protein J7T55_010495 [Diaporthe amygdali]KAJ0115672.1 hypothetical protein J7T55_010495 [Diaporthe amygdali]
MRLLNLDPGLGRIRAYGNSRFQMHGTQNCIDDVEPRDISCALLVMKLQIGIGAHILNQSGSVPRFILSRLPTFLPEAVAPDVPAWMSIDMGA